MKKLNQKEWGIISTSIGSILIIVALLTMVGVGSNDTYAASVKQDETNCSCPEEYDKSGNRCVKQTKTYYTCTTGGTASRVCPADISNCQYQGNNRYQCSEYTLDEKTCTCPSGMVASGTGDCKIISCPEGQYYDVNINDCDVCPIGKYCPAGSSSPIDCPVGKYCPGENKVYTCPAGTYCPESGLSLGLPCPVGKYCPGENKVYTCPAGTYCPTSGMTSSLICPAGSYCPGGEKKYSCSAGKYCPEGSESPIDCPANATCTSSSFTCNKEDGYIMNGTKTGCINPGPMPEETPCYGGTYYNGSNSCKSCPAGFYCPGGTFSHQKGDIDGSGRIACPANATCRANSATFECNDKYIEVNGQCLESSSVGTCQPGTFYPGTGTTCQPCPVNSYCPGGNYKVNSKEIVGRKDCPANATCTASTFTCNDNYTEVNGECLESSSVETCQPGTFYPGTGTTCQQCPVNSYCPGGNYKVDLKEIVGRKDCPANAICTSISFTCNPGYGKNATKTGCELCPTGQYSSSGVCLACPANAKCTPDSFTCMEPYEKNQAGTACVLNEQCDAGSYKTLGGYCAMCPAGSFCPKDSSSPQQCKAGTYCPAGSGSPKDCPKNATCSANSATFTCTGNYIKNSNSNATYCYNPDTGTSSDKTICPAGTYYNGNKKCVSCEAGYSCPQAQIVYANNSTAGSGRTKCDSGTYCLGGTNNPERCPSDKPYSETGAKSENECKAITDNSGGSSNTPSGGNNSGMGGNQGPNSGNSNINKNPHTTTKTPLIIAIIGILSISIGTLTYFKSKKETNPKI